MARNFLSINSSYNDFASYESRDINKYVLENQDVVLSKVYGFFQKPDNVLLVSGFFGTGKTQVVKHLLNYLDKTVSSFKLECSASTTLDDIMLLLWAQFISQADNAEIAYHYRQVSSFQDKITGCFSELNSNIVITFFDFDLIDDKNLNDILDFIWTVSKDEKVKVVIVSKTFDTTLIPEDVTYTKVILKALSRIVFEKFLQDKGIKATPRIYDELYKITRGYYFYTEISALILLKKELSVSDFLVAYTNSGMSFDKFLAKAFISMLPDEVFNLLVILAFIRHPVNSQMLDYLEVYDQYSIDYLKQNRFIKVSDDLFILNNYFRKAVLNELDAQDTNKYHNLLLKFYNSQLPLKPSERLIMLSRTTMRSEILYHTSIVNPPQDTSVEAEKTLEELGDITSSDLLIKADSLYDEYKYQDALRYYLELLSRGDIQKDVIQLKLAYLYEKIGNWKYSLHYFNLLLKHYEEINDENSINSVRIQIAQIYYQSYKTNDAINILYEIISEATDMKIAIKAYTLLGNIYISLAAKDKAYELYNKAVMLSERVDNVENLSELYFKFAILADENDKTDIALSFYKRCIDVSADDNKYKSLAYSNLGDLYLDYGNKQKAIEFFKSAYNLDSLNNNDYGVYYSASNIAKLIIKNSPDEGFIFLQKAKTAAIKTNDIFAMANSGLHLGDYYSNNNFIEKALKEYFSVLSLVKDKFSEDNKKKILIRIDDIKHKIGVDKFDELYGNNYK